MSYNGTYYYYLKDVFGNITHIYDRADTLMAAYVYDAWGNCKITYNYNDIANINPFRYRGYYYDVESDLYYLQSRYYDPALRRFLSLDSYDLIPSLAESGDLNLYVYCGNNPVMNVDPTGYAPEWWQWALFGVGIALVAVAAGMAILGTGGVAAFGMGALIGSLVVGAGGAVVGGVIGYATEGVDGILGGVLAGFGIGAIVGFVVGGSVGTGIYGSQLGTTYKGVGQLVKNPKIEWLSSKFPHVGQRMAERNVSSKLIGKTLKNGYAFMQTSDKYLIVGRKAAVVITSAGEVITTWASNNYDQKLMDVLRSIFGF